MRFISQLFRIFIKDTAKFSSIKNSSNAEKSVYFGVVSILSATLGSAICAGMGIGGVFLINSIGNSQNPITAIFIIIFGATLAISGALGFVLSLIRGIITSSYQLKLKRKTIGFIALVLNILILIAIIVLFYLTVLK